METPLTSWKTRLRPLFEAKNIRPVLTTVFMAPSFLFFATILFLSLVDEIYEGVTFKAVVDSFPIAMTMAAGVLGVTALFRTIQVQFRRFFSVSYFFCFPVLGVVLLFIRQAFPLGQNHPEVWDLVGNQISFTAFITIFTFAFNQAIGMTLDRLSEENNRANDALEALEKQHLLLISSQEQVRKEVATFLHDELQSNLVVLGLQVKNTMATLPEKYQSLGAAFVDEIERMRSVDVKTAIRQLSPELESVSLEFALEELAHKYTQVMQIRVDLGSEISAPDLDMQLKLGIYRIVEQGLLNAAVHGKAKVATVNAVATENRITLAIVNDGTPPEFPVTAGTGLSVIDGWCKVFSGSWTLNRVEGSTILGVTLVRSS